MSASWYLDGSLYVCVVTGMPEHNVEIGVGDTYADAVASLEATPIQSTGRDSGKRAALHWAYGADWISDPDKLEPDDGPDHEALVSEVEDAASSAAEWEGWEWSHDPGGIYTEGPGTVDDWDAWEKERYDELTEEDVREVIGAEPDEKISKRQIREACEGIAQAEREYGEEAQDAADGARELGEQCVAAAKVGDYAEALEQASKLEYEYGDDPSYGPLVKACKALVDVTP
jgi:hypothetical protein